MPLRSREIRNFKSSKQKLERYQLWCIFDNKKTHQRRRIWGMFRTLDWVGIEEVLQNDVCFFACKHPIDF